MASGDLENTALVEIAIQPHERGRVRFQGSWWFALCEHKRTFLPGSRVLVVGRKGITLLVDEFITDADSESEDSF